MKCIKCSKARKRREPDLEGIERRVEIKSLVFGHIKFRNILATWCKELTHLKRPRGWERLKEGEKRTTEDEIVGWHH